MVRVMSLSAKNVLITGAEGALGSVVLRKFASAGVTAIGTYLKAPHPEIPESERVKWVKMDVTQAKSVQDGIKALAARGIEIDGLVHCAGGFRYLSFEKTSDEDLDFLFNTNLRSAFLLIREVLGGMKKQGFGRIVLISSKSTLNAASGLAAYSAAKSGLNMIVSSLADEVRAFDINVNAVMPTVIDTAANRKDMPTADFATWVKPQELAEIIFSLTQPWGKPIHGALIPVAGRV